MKSGNGPEEWHEFFRLASSAIADTEGYPRLEGHRDETDLVGRLAKAESGLNACASLRAFSSSQQTILDASTRIAKYYLIEIDLESFRSTIYLFWSQQQATDHYSERELQIAREGLPVDAVLVSASDLDSLARGYPNYFLDTSEFVSLIEKLTCAN